MRTGDHSWNHRARQTLLLVLGSGALTSACVIEELEAIIAEHGVTYWPTSTGESDGEGDSSTSTSTGTSTDTSADVGGSGTSTSSEETGGSASMGSGTGSSSSGGPALPVCGDGVVEGDETCDDGNLVAGDGCQECAKDSIMFITSEVYQGFALGGLYGADQRCRSLAAKANLPRFLTYKAWLSTASTSAADRLLHSRGRYVLVNGLVVAQNWDALTSGTLESPIMVDEYSQTRDWGVWTGTLASGQPALGSAFCGDWDDEAAVLKSGGNGLSANTDAGWSFFEHLLCASEERLFCVEQ